MLDLVNLLSAYPAKPTLVWCRDLQRYLALANRKSFYGTTEKRIPTKMEAQNKKNRGRIDKIIKRLESNKN